MRIVQLGALTREQAALHRGLQLGFGFVATRRRQLGIEGSVRPLEFTAIDDRGDLAKTRELLEQRLGDKRCDLIVGSPLERLRDPKVAKLLRDHSVLVFEPDAWTSSADRRAPSTMRAPIETLVEALTKRLVGDGCERLGIVLPHGESSLRETASKVFERQGVHPVAWISMDASGDGKLEARGMQKLRPDAVLLLCDATHALRFARRFDALRGDAIVRYAMTADVGAQALVQALGDAADGSYVASSFPWPWLDALPIANDYRTAIEAQKASVTDLQESRVFEGFALALLLERVVDREIGGLDVATQLEPTLAGHEPVLDLDGLRMAWPKRRPHGGLRAYLSVVLRGKLEFSPADDEASPSK